MIVGSQAASTYEGNRPTHRLTLSSGRVYLDGSPITLKPDGYNVRIGCTEVELNAIEHIYNALKTLGFIR